MHGFCIFHDVGRCGAHFIGFWFKLSLVRCLKMHNSRCTHTTCQVPPLPIIIYLLLKGPLLPDLSIRPIHACNMRFGAQRRPWYEIRKGTSNEVGCARCLCRPIATVEYEENTFVTLEGVRSRQRHFHLSPCLSLSFLIYLDDDLTDSLFGILHTRDRVVVVELLTS